MKKYFLPIAIFLASLTFIIVGVVPAFNNYQSADQLLKDKQKNQDQLLAKLNSLKNINEYQQNQELQFAIQSLPLLAPYQQTLTLLDELSKTHSVIVSELEINPGKGNILLKFTAAGELNKLEEFALALNQSLPISTTNQIELLNKITSADKTASASAATALYSANMQTTFQYKVTPQTIGKISDSLPAISGSLEQILKQLKTYNTLSAKTPISADKISKERVSKLFPE